MSVWHLTRDQNQESVLAENRLPVVLFLGIVGLPAYRSCLSVVALELQLADFSLHVKGGSVEFLECKHLFLLHKKTR